MNEELLSNLSLISERAGRLKDLSGYQKPSLGAQKKSGLNGLGTEEVARAGEELFAAIRPAMGYKRKDVAFSQEGSSAVLLCRDFDVVVAIAPRPDDEDGYVLRQTVGNFKNPELFHLEAFNEIFGKSFQRLELKSKTPVKVEDWIDRVEDRDLEEEWQLRYPPDYSHCTLRLPRSEFEIKITPERLIMTRLLPGSALEFWEGFEKLSPVLHAD